MEGNNKTRTDKIVVIDIVQLPSRRLLCYCRNKQCCKTTSKISRGSSNDAAASPLNATFVIFFTFNSFSLVLGYMSITVTLLLFSLLRPYDRVMTREQKTKWTRTKICCSRRTIFRVLDQCWTSAHNHRSQSPFLCVRTNSSLDFLECIHSTRHTQERDGQTVGRVSERSNIKSH